MCLLHFILESGDTPHCAGAEQMRAPHTALLTCAPLRSTKCPCHGAYNLTVGQKGALRIAQVHGERARAGAVGLGVGVVAVEARPPLVHHAACALAVLHTLAMAAHADWEHILDL